LGGVPSWPAADPSVPGLRGLAGHCFHGHLPSASETGSRQRKAATCLAAVSTEGGARAFLSGSRVGAGVQRDRRTLSPGVCTGGSNACVGQPSLSSGRQGSAPRLSERFSSQSGVSVRHVRAWGRANTRSSEGSFDRPVLRSGGRRGGSCFGGLPQRNIGKDLSSGPPQSACRNEAAELPGRGERGMRSSWAMKALD